MRELVFVPLVGLLCVLGLARPEVAMCSYLWYGLMRPDIFAFVENKYPVSLVFGIVTILSTVIFAISDAYRCLFANPLVQMLFFLQIPVFISVVFAFNPDLSFPRYSFYIRVIAILILIPCAIRTEEHMKMAFLTVACSLGFLGVKFGLYGIVAGGADLSARGWGEMLADNNFFGLAMATNLAMCWYGRALVSSRFFKTVLLGMFGCTIAAIVMSSSRGSVLSAGVALLMIVIRSKYKVVSLLVVAAMMAGSVYLVQDMFFKRMRTLTQENQEASAESRVEHAKIALRMYADHPFFGVGFGGLNYGNLVKRYNASTFSALNQHVVHNSYLQELVDSGPVAFLLYVGEILYAIWWLGRTRKRMQAEQASASAMAITRGLQVSVVAFAFGSTFYSANRMDLLYILLMLTAAWYAIQKQQVETARAAAMAAAPAFRPRLREAQLPAQANPFTA